MELFYNRHDSNILFLVSSWIIFYSRIHWNRSSSSPGIEGTRFSAYTKRTYILKSVKKVTKRLTISRKALHSMPGNRNYTIRSPPNQKKKKEIRDRTSCGESDILQLHVSKRSYFSFTYFLSVASSTYMRCLFGS